jgi:hypothetical protein
MLLSHSGESDLQRLDKSARLGVCAYAARTIRTTHSGDFYEKSLRKRRAFSADRGKGNVMFKATGRLTPIAAFEACLHVMTLVKNIANSSVNLTA